MKKVSKKLIESVQRFNNDLCEFAKLTGDKYPVLYEDQYTSFTLCDLSISENSFFYTYDGIKDSLPLISDSDIDIFKDYLSFYKKCLKRAIKYYSYDCETIDILQDQEQTENF